MPYIDKQSRIGWDFWLNNKDKPDFVKIGNLNYVISKLCLLYLQEKGESYQTYNDIIGVLECAKQEIYRKMVSKYEDKKEQENGTIW